MCGPSYKKEEKNKPSRGGNNHGSIITYGRIPRSMHQYKIGAGITKESNKRQKGEYTSTRTRRKGPYLEATFPVNYRLYIPTRNA